MVNGEAQNHRQLVELDGAFTTRSGTKAPQAATWTFSSRSGPPRTPGPRAGPRPSWLSPGAGSTISAVARAVGTFVNETYEEVPYDDSDGVSLGRIRITRSFSGDIVGQSSAELLTARSADGSTAYVALDRLSAVIDGKAGSFVLQHWGTISGDGAVTDGAVVPGSGSGELRGLRGRCRIAVDEQGTHTLELDYSLGG